MNEYEIFARIFELEAKERNKREEEELKRLKLLEVKSEEIEETEEDEEEYIDEYERVGLCRTPYGII